MDTDTGEDDFIARYDSLEDPDLRAEFLAATGRSRADLDSMRRRQARRRSRSTPAEQAPAPSSARPVPGSSHPVPRRHASIRRPTTPRPDGGPRAHPVARSPRKPRVTVRTVVTETTTTTTETVTVRHTVTTVTTEYHG